MAMEGESRARFLRRFLGMDREIAGVLLVLAIAQLFGWGTLGLPAIAATALRPTSTSRFRWCLQGPRRSTL